MQRPPQQFLLNMHRRPPLVQSTAGRCWLSDGGVKLAGWDSRLPHPACLRRILSSLLSRSLSPPCSPVKPSQCPPGPRNWFLSCLKWSKCDGGGGVGGRVEGSATAAERPPKTLLGNRKKQSPKNPASSLSNQPLLKRSLNSIPLCFLCVLNSSAAKNTAGKSN